MIRRTALALSIVVIPLTGQAPERSYTRADTLRGSWDTPGRNWWDVTYYDLELRVNPADSSIAGRNAISYRVTSPGTLLQIDLMTPLVLDSVTQDGRRLDLTSDGNAHFATVATPQQPGTVRTVTAHYHGRPRIAPRPPWDGGFTWGRDSLDRNWVVTTDQGVGASIWWPNKDTQADEPDSQRVAMRVPDPLMHVGAGRLRSRTPHDDGTTTWEWFVTNPINNYAIALAVGNYAHWSERYPGEAGWLTMDYYPLDYHLEAARKQWLQARTTMQCFEWWYGPYPFYEDGYKLIEASNNGMEHQSAVTYGNGFANGYRGRDGSGTGLGMLFDFIIVHESAHEWWGNNITTRDLADMWVHESFANYSEGLYVECLFGKEAGAEYIRGVRRGIGNRQPIVPPHRGVNAQGSGDMYPKGGNMLHTIRQIIDDDALWRDILRGLQRTYRHAIVDGSDVRNYISRRAGIDLSRVFDQYLTRANLPVFEYQLRGNTLRYRWADVVDGFDMPIDVAIGSDPAARLHPATDWQETTMSDPGAFAVDHDWYVVVREVTQ